MSLFKSLFGNPKEAKQTKDKINWTPLTKINQLDEIAEVSNMKSVLIFKHSTRCSVSRMALKQFENEFDLSDAVDMYFLDLLDYRDVSNVIENRFQVVHQSPQLLLIKKGKSVYDVSHSEIDATALKAWL